MKLKWQQLSTLHKSPRPLTLLASKDPFFLRYGLDFIKKNTGDKKLESIIIDKQFNWQDWYHHEVMAQDLFGTQAKIFMIHLSEKLNKDAEAILNQLADETSPH